MITNQQREQSPTWASIKLYFRKHEQTLSGYAFLLPTILSVLIFTVLPVGFSFYISFFKFNFLSPATDFVGLQNYIRLFTNDRFWTALGNTFRYVIGVVPFGMAFSLGLALLINRKLPGMNFFRSAYFSPVITSSIAVALIWQWIFDPNYGLLNFFLGEVGITGITWLQDPNMAMWCIAFMAVWSGAGYNMILFLAGLQGISEEYYDAATVDGANRLQIFRYITWPLLSPTTFFIFIVGIIGALQVFDMPWLVSKGLGGPIGSTRTIVFYLWEQGFKYYDMGYASALAYILFFIIFVFTLINWRYSSRYVHYQ
jgi:multiple sugar transport system permease protein